MTQTPYVSNTVQFSRPAAGVNKAIRMSSPKRYTDEMSWLRAAQKAIPEIPWISGVSRVAREDLLVERGRWIVKETLVESRVIIFHLFEAETLERAAVVIKRGG